MSKSAKSKSMSATSPAWLEPTSEPITAWAEQALAAAARKAQPGKAAQGFAIAAPELSNLLTVEREVSTASILPLDHDNYYGTDAPNVVTATDYHEVYTYGDDDDIFLNYDPAIGAGIVRHIDGGMNTTAGRDALHLRASDDSGTDFAYMEVDFLSGEISYLDADDELVLLATFTGIEELEFYGFSVDIVGDDNANHITVDANHGHIEGRGGNDVLTGSDNTSMSNDGADWFYGEDGNDYLYGRGESDHLFGGNHDDRLYGEVGGDQLYGGTGSDTIYGGDNGDGLYGDEGNDTLYGDAGDDYLVGGKGNDLIAGGAGDDLYQIANDYVDTNFSYSHLDLVLRTSKIVSTAGTTIDVDTFNGISIERFRGTTKQDKMYGDSNANKFYGDSGNDILSGKAGADVLSGGSGHDELYGGNDTSVDIFEFDYDGGIDKIFDFTVYDLLDVRELGITSFSQIEWDSTGGTTHIYLDNEGVDTIVWLVGYTTTLTASDFIFATPMP